MIASQRKPYILCFNECSVHIRCIIPIKNSWTECYHLQGSQSSFNFYLVFSCILQSLNSSFFLKHKIIEAIGLCGQFSEVNLTNRLIN